MIIVSKCKIHFELITLKVIHCFHFREINGLKICYKIGKNQNESNSVLYPQVPSS